MTFWQTATMAHPFLSTAWVEAALDLQDEFVDRVPSPAQLIRLNLTITEAPDDDDIELHLDNTSGLPRLSHGHLDDPDATLITDFATAKSVFLANNQQATMQAFMAGQIRVIGDMAKLMAVQISDTTPTDIHDELSARLQAMTAD